MTVSENTDEKSRVRAPIQARSQKRIDAAKAAAAQLLAEFGPEAVSIPDIANAAGVPRATIYQYFPDKYALFAHLAAGHFERVLTYIADSIARKDVSTWKDIVCTAVEASADYYNSDAASRILLLTGPFAARDGEAHAAKNVALAELLRERFSRTGDLRNLPNDPDAIGLAIEIAFACLKYGYFREGSISTPITAEATRAALRYLEVWE